ncbi:RING-H2 finger protein ATL18 [Tanacetum coccineum]
MVLKSEILNDFLRFLGVLIMEFVASGVDVISKFYSPSRWKELSKETSSKILLGVSPSVTDEIVVKEKQSPLVDTSIPTTVLSSLDDTTVLGSFPPLSTPVTTTADNAPGKSSYANVTGKPSGKKLNIHTLFTPGKWHPDENLLKEDVSTIPVWVKLYGVPVRAFNDDGLSAIYTKIGRAMSVLSMSGNLLGVRLVNIHEECPKNTGAGEKKTLRKPSQTSQGVPVGPKIGFKPQKEYRRVTKKPNAISSGNKKKGVEPTIEVSNSNLFDVLNSVDNDVKFVTNRGTTNLVNNGATSSGSSFMNIDNDGEFASNTLIGEKIDKIKRQICEGKLKLLDNNGNPLIPTAIVENDSEVEVVFDETANLRISTGGKDVSDKGYGTNSLLE